MVNSKDVFCVIMAGGIGSRFWPLSRTQKPKQFLDILGTGESLLRQTFKRVTKFCELKNVFVVTGKEYKNLVLEQLPELGANQIILEPMRRNTAPCIEYANQKIKAINPNAIVVVAPSDHLVLEQEKFVSTIQTAVNFAANHSALLTIGIKPSRPETGYGYIQTCNLVDKAIPNLFNVKTFTEKPNLELAKIFLESGEFYWNSGIFIWSLENINDAFQKYLPEVHSLFSGITNSLNTVDEEGAVESVYSQCKNISIDYGILEKSDNVYVICSEFGWSDLGTWGSLHQNFSKDKNGNAIVGGNVMAYGVTNSIINVPAEKLVVVEGLDNYIIAEEDNILLICRRESEQDIKTFQNDVLIEKGDKFI